MSALTVKGKRYFSPAHSDDDYHCLMAVMNIVKEAREKKGYSQSELARITFASFGLAEIPRIDAINISQTVSVLKLLLTLAVSGLMMNTSQQHSKTRNGIEPSKTQSLPRKRMSGDRTTVKRETTGG